MTLYIYILVLSIASNKRTNFPYLMIQWIMGSSQGRFWRHGSFQAWWDHGSGSVSFAVLSVPLSPSATCVLQLASLVVVRWLRTPRASYFLICTGKIRERTTSHRNGTKVFSFALIRLTQDNLCCKGDEMEGHPPILWARPWIWGWEYLAQLNGCYATGKEQIPKGNARFCQEGFRSQMGATETQSKSRNASLIGDEVRRWARYCEGAEKHQTQAKSMKLWS